MNRSYQKRRLMRGLGLTRSLKPSTPKQLLLDAVSRLPDQTSYEEVFNLAYFLGKIDELLTDFEQGRLVPETEYEQARFETIYGTHDN